MISVEEAYRTIIAAFRPLPAARVPLLEATDRVLAEDVVSPEAIPPFDNSAMDGYAVRFADCASASEAQPVALAVLADLAAGYTTDVEVAPGTAVRIMTGAPIPRGADAVVMREETREAPDRVEILVPPEEGEHIRRAGEDIARGSTVFTAGTVLTPAALGVLASLGVAEVPVVRRPRVALLATGDELVALGEPLGPGQIRNSSAYALEALVRQMGAEPVQLGIAKDEPDALRARIEEGAHADLLITTGGVSVGDYDLVKDILEQVGRMNFWKVNMQPGKPLAFGLVGDTPVVGLPGNPVSSLVSFEVFVRPAIRKLMGHARLEKPRLAVALSAPIDKKNARRQFLRARITYEGAQFRATLAGAQGSHVLSGVARANGLLILPEGSRRYEAGDVVEGILLDGGDLYACGRSDAE